MDSSSKIEKQGLEKAPPKKDAAAVKDPAKIGDDRSESAVASSGDSKKALSTPS
jgi:hypothetical protein